MSGECSRGLFIPAGNSQQNSVYAAFTKFQYVSNRQLVQIHSVHRRQFSLFPMRTFSLAANQYQRFLHGAATVWKHLSFG
jgi:hypothetical protein